MLKIEAKIKAQELKGKINTVCDVIGNTSKDNTSVLVKEDKNGLKIIGKGKNEEFISTVIKCEELQIEGEGFIDIGQLGDKLSFYTHDNISISNKAEDTLLFKGTKFQVPVTIKNTSNEDSNESDDVEDLEELIKFKKTKYSDLKLKNKGSFSITKDNLDVLDRIAKTLPFKRRGEEGGSSIRADIFPKGNGVMAYSSSSLGNSNAIGAYRFKCLKVEKPSDEEFDNFFTIELSTESIKTAKKMVDKLKDTTDKEKDIVISLGSHGIKYLIGKTVLVASIANNSMTNLQKYFKLKPKYTVSVEKKELTGPVGFIGKELESARSKQIREDDLMDFNFNSDKSELSVGLKDYGKNKKANAKMSLSYKTLEDLNSPENNDTMSVSQRCVANALNLFSENKLNLSYQEDVKYNYMVLSHKGNSVEFKCFMVLGTINDVKKTEPKKDKSKKKDSESKKDVAKKNKTELKKDNKGQKRKSI